MGTGLVSFVFHTIQPRMNTPANATFFLPGLLNNITSGGKNVLPLTEDEWSLGTIGGSVGQTAAQAFANGWYSLTAGRMEGAGGHRGIGCPANPFPSLSLSKVTMEALDNVTLDDTLQVTPLDTGYRVVLQLTQGLFSDVPGVTNGPISLSSGYTLTQCLCTTGTNDMNPTTCDGFIPQVSLVGIGTIAGSIAAVTVTVTATLGVGPDSTLAVAVESMTAAAPAGSTFDVQSLTVTNSAGLTKIMVEAFAATTLASPDALAGMLQNLNQALNTPENLGAVQSQLNSALNSGLNDVLGPVPASGLVTDTVAPGTNPVDTYLFQRIHTSLATQGTDYYVPTAILFFRNPTLEPYAASSISIPDQSFDGITFSRITLSNVIVAGTSNSVLPSGSMSLAGAAVTANASISTLSPGPTLTSSVNGSPETATVPNPPLTLTGGFSVVPGASPNPLTGTITITVSASQAQSVFTVAGADVSTLTITFTSMVASAQPAAVKISVDLPGGGFFTGVINSALNTPDCIAQILAGLNGQLVGQLGAISQTATTNVRTLATQKLGG